MHYHYVLQFNNSICIAHSANKKQKVIIPIVILQPFAMVFSSHGHSSSKARQSLSLHTSHKCVCICLLLLSIAPNIFIYALNEPATDNQL